MAVTRDFPTQDGVSPPGEVPAMAGEAVRAEHLLPLQVRERTFRVIDGERLDERLPLELRRTRGEEPGEWVLEFSDLNTLYLSVHPEGALTIVRLDLPSEDFAVVYDPPVRMLPAEIRPHEQIVERSTVRVYSLETGELEHTGNVEHKVLFASRSRLTTDVGVWDGYLIPIEHKIDIPWADVRLDLAGGYVPEVGIVYRRMEYTRTSIGLFGETVRRAAVLSEEVN
ncbi:MAG: hypothetical protein WD294_10050 [Phycisphaeraceae bacterium]